MMSQLQPQGQVKQFMDQAAQMLKSGAAQVQKSAAANTKQSKGAPIVRTSGVTFEKVYNARGVN